jgi:hypothetical protein
MTGQIQHFLGPADAIEAEYGYAAPFGGAFSVLTLLNGEFLEIDAFATLESAKAAFEWGQHTTDGDLTVSYYRV